MFGNQLVCDKDENILYDNNRLLSLPINVSINNVAQKVTELQGIMYPAHIDRQAYSIMRILGFIPDNLNIHAVEIANDIGEARKKYRFLNSNKYTIIQASDAHDIDQLGSRTTRFYIEKPTFDEIKKAIEQIDGRRAEIFSKNDQQGIEK